MARVRAFSGAPWESKVGYCRALRTGDRIFVTGTVSVAPEGGAVFAPGDAYRQASRCLDIIEEALRELGAGPEHVVRTRMFVTDIDLWEDVGRAHAERFGNAPPCTTLVEVSRLIDPSMLVEIEADAVVDT
jgi:enamine deaminase RidA (YjgF/YER057c/UK114 family)